MTIRSQDPVNLAQHAVRVIMRLENVRQQQYVNRIGGYSEAIQSHNDIRCAAIDISNYRGSLRSGERGKPVCPPGTDLQKLIAEHAVQGGADMPAFLLDKSLSGIAPDPIHIHC